MNDDSKNPPERHKRRFIEGALGAALGAGIGAYVSVVRGSDIYLGIGALIGFIGGVAIGSWLQRSVPPKSLITAERITNIVLGLASLVLASAGIIGFILTHQLVGIVGAVFFGLCGIYIWRRPR